MNNNPNDSQQSRPKPAWYNRPLPAWFIISGLLAIAVMVVAYLCYLYWISLPGWRQY